MNADQKPFSHTFAPLSAGYAHEQTRIRTLTAEDRKGWEQVKLTSFPRSRSILGWVVGASFDKSQDGLSGAWFIVWQATSKFQN